MIKKHSRLRRGAGAVLLLVLISLPFLRINGESAVRFDVPALRFLLFGAEIGMADSFIILIALIFFTFFTLFATSLLGRVWCGWLCPQTILLDLADFVRGLKSFGTVSGSAATTLVFVIAGVIAASFIGYFVPPHELPDTLRRGNLAAKVVLGSWLSLTVLLYLELTLLGRRFCATVCPYAKLQSVLFDDRTLQVAFDTRRADECMDCKACVKACPVAIDIRKGAQIECIHCAECVDACTERMAMRKKRSLVAYFFGLPGKQESGLRINLLITGSAAILSLLLFVTASSQPFDFTVRLAHVSEPGEQPDGTLRNAYEVSLRNRSSTDLVLELTAASHAGLVAIFPSTVTVKRGPDVTRIPATVTLKGFQGRGRDQLVTITVRSPEHDRSMDQQVYFLLPQNK